MVILYLFVKFTRDAILISLVNCGTSLYGGFAVFSVLGYMAHTLGTEIENVTDAGYHSCYFIH